MSAVDTDFSDAHWQALSGDASAMAAIIRDPQRSLDQGQREYLATMIERLAEYARGDVGGTVGRRRVAGGNPKVTRAAYRYMALLADGRQKSEAKAMVAEELKVSLRTVSNYLRLDRERSIKIAGASN